ncbi:phosphate acyltransferase [Roseibacillus persicicus]|uniref:phosphate acyltransferase n=1 Tax=Roseibacillus persicicus TaxID=454148 RepID=UPI00398B5D1A
MSEIGSGWAEPDVFTGPLFEILKRHPKRIVFSEGEDPRVVQVAAEMVRLEIGIPILLGNKEKVRAMATKLGAKMDFVKVIDPNTADDLDLFTELLIRIEKLKGINLANPRETVSRSHFFAAMMIQYGQADAMVGGNINLPATIHRALVQLVKPMPGVSHPFTAAIMVSEKLPHFGPDGVLFLGDCGITDIPTVSELTNIAVETGRLAHHYVGRRVRVAMLSHSSMNSAASDSAARVRAATDAARALVSHNRYEIEIDGELQADVALDPAAAEVKLPQMVNRPPADVLVFPNLDAAHISMKLLRHVGGATKYGQLVLGLTRPAAQVPRTVTPRSLLGTAAAVGVEAIKYHEMFPHG